MTAQENEKFEAELASQVCDCLGKQKTGISEDEIKDAFQQCTMSIMMARLTEFQEVYGEEAMNDRAKGQAIGQRVGLKVVSDCPKFMELMMAAKMNGEEKEEESAPDTAPSSTESEDDDIKINELSPTLKKLAESACDCMQDKTIQFEDSDALSDVIMNCISQEEAAMEAYLSESNLEELSPAQTDQLGVDIAAYLFGSCPVFFKKAYPIIAKEAGLSLEDAGEPKVPSGNLEQDMSASACDCLSKVSEDASKEEVLQAVEKCFSVAAIQNYQGMMDRFGVQAVLEMNDDSILDDLMNKTMAYLFKTCDKGAALLMKLGQ